MKVVIQHHENNDGTGYPYGIGGSDIHLFGHIARIVDAYDAMTSDRPYAAAMKPFATLAEIKKENQICFNEELLKEFICFLGLKDPRSKSSRSWYNAYFFALRKAYSNYWLCYLFQCAFLIKLLN